MYIQPMRSLLFVIFALSVVMGLLVCTAKEKKDDDKVPQATKEAELQDSTRLDSAKADSGQ